MKLSDYILNKPLLETDRLILRELNINDVDDLREWTADKSIYKYWGMRPGKNDLNPELLFTKETKPVKSFHWGIVYKPDNKVIGESWIYLIENDRMASLACRLSPHYHSKGLATEAVKEIIDFVFNHTELQRIWAGVHIDNHPSYKLLEKVGFTREGLIRKGKMVNTYCDYYIYGMLKSDYNK